MAGMKEFKDVVAALNQVLVAYEHAMADGEIDLGDVAQLPALIQKAKEAVEGIKDVPMEFKDATPEELGDAFKEVVVLVQKIIEVVSK